MKTIYLKLDENNIIQGYFTHDTGYALQVSDNFNVDTLVFGCDYIESNQIVKGDKVAYNTIVQSKKTAEIEQQNKYRRISYIDAYRKYQAAVNYGEIERAPNIDVFINALKNKDWEAFNNIPPQIEYFMGNIGFAESGLINKTI